MNITTACFAGKPEMAIGLILLEEVDKAQTWSYGELYHKIKKLSKGLQELKLKPFSTILIRSELTVDSLLLYFAAMHASLVPCILDPFLTKQEIVVCLEEANAALYYESSSLALEPPLPRSCKLLTQAELEDLKEFKADESEPKTKGDDRAFLVFTAGSMTKPKAVFHGHRSLIAREPIREGWLSLIKEDRLLHTSSSHTAYGLQVNFFDTWFLGSCAVAFSGTLTAIEVLQIIDRYKVTVLASIPTFYKEMLYLPEEVQNKFSLTSLRLAISAEEPLSATLQQEFERKWHKPLLQGFTLTEMEVPLFETISMKRKYGSLGKVYGSCPIKIAPSLETEGEGGKGILALSIKDPAFMVSSPEEANLQGDFYLTGDIVSKDEEGYFYHHGRSGAILKSVGALRVSAEEIEEVFRSHRYVSEVAAITTENEEGEAILTLFVVPYQIEEEENLLEERLLAYAKKQLSSLKIPQRIVFLEHLPKNPNGTIDRKALHFL
jgi:acetyl-CoA synthetase